MWHAAALTIIWIRSVLDLISDFAVIKILGPTRRIWRLDPLEWRKENCY